MVLGSGGKFPSAGKSMWGAGFLPSVYQGVQCRSHGEPVLFLSNPPSISRELRGDMIETIARINQRAYEEFGDDCVAKFRGMFDFAVWDVSRQRMLLARDRVGVKQLFYTVVGGQLIWGSEIKAILASCLVARDLDVDALAEFLAE